MNKTDKAEALIKKVAQRNKSSVEAENINVKFEVRTQQFLLYLCKKGGIILALLYYAMVRNSPAVRPEIAFPVNPSSAPSPKEM